MGAVFFQQAVNESIPAGEGSGAVEESGHLGIPFASAGHTQTFIYPLFKMTKQARQIGHFRFPHVLKQCGYIRNQLREKSFAPVHTRQHNLPQLPGRSAGDSLSIYPAYIHIGVQKSSGYTSAASANFRKGSPGKWPTPPAPTLLAKTLPFPSGGKSIHTPEQWSWSEPHSSPSPKEKQNLLCSDIIYIRGA